ncbi:hypothetical protein [Streptomyces sp. NPDC058989]|uniref:hypothetical protein n=1 Tax=Streptomyces sp. NPDC058989 TaxID=3346686 RepID=UPI00369A8B8A
MAERADSRWGTGHLASSRRTPDTCDASEASDTCDANNQRLFCSTVCVDTWLHRTGQERGDVMDLGTLWGPARDWYTGRLVVDEVESDGSFAVANLVVVPRVTRVDIARAVERLSRSDFAGLMPRVFTAGHDSDALSLMDRTGLPTAGIE